MRKKITRSFLITSFLSFIVGFGVLYGVLYNRELNQEKEYLMETVNLIEKLQIDETKQDELGNVFLNEDVRLTIINKDGTVIYDNEKESISEKHLERQEVQQALQSGTGSSIRYSDTMELPYLYVAVYEKDNNTIIRLATPFEGIKQSASLLAVPFIFSLIISLFVMYFSSRKMSNSIVRPLEDITNTILDSDLSNNTLEFDHYEYPEIVKITDALTSMSKEIQENVEKLNKEKKVRQEFFTNASHELKTPLTSVRGYTELIRSHTITDQKQVDTCLDCVLKESDHMTQLINDILTISKLETEEMKVTYTHIHVKKLLESILESLQPQIDQMEISLYTDVTDFTVYASMDHIRGIFYNLVSNAIKYNKQKGRIEVTLKKDQKDMYFSVEDTGIGIAKKDQERIFQRFYRVDKQRSKVIPGTGLGLSIVKHIVQYYHGHIELISREDIGSKMIVTLPIVVNERPEH